MKPVTTKKPKLILEVYRTQLEYGKDQRSYDTRRGLIDWKQEVPVLMPYLEDGKLMLPQEEPDDLFWNADLIILDHDNHATMAEPNFTYYYVTLGNRRSQIYTNFQTNIKGDELELHYVDGSRHMRKIFRDDFKLADLRMDVPTEVKFNYILELRTRGRRYVEKYYLFHLIGSCRKFVFDAPINTVYSKPIPQPVKTINLMRTLY